MHVYTSNPQGVPNSLSDRFKSLITGDLFRIMEHPVSDFCKCAHLSHRHGRPQLVTLPCRATTLPGLRTDNKARIIIIFLCETKFLI